MTHEAADPAYAEFIPTAQRQAVLGRLPPVKQPFILTVSHTYPHKNIHALVDAFGEIMDNVLHSSFI